MWLKLILVAVGTLTLSLLVWHVGPARIWDAAAQVGPVGLLLALLPSLAMYVFEAYGWVLTLGPSASGLSFLKVFAIRTAGEVVNMTTPAAYVGGEPLKAYLLKREGVSIVEGMASVVLAKTVMTIAQVVFILAGIGLAVWLVGHEHSATQVAVASLVSAALLLFGVAGFIAAQRWGLFAGSLRLLQTAGIRIGFLEARTAQLEELDRTIAAFYRTDRVRFSLSTGCFLGGWLCEAVEVWVMLALLGQPVTAGAALAIGGLSSLVKGGTFFIPGSLGPQDGGNLLLVSAFGYSDLSGVSFALLRRFREIVWIVIGLVCLSALGGRTVVPSSPEREG